MLPPPILTYKTSCKTVLYIKQFYPLKHFLNRLRFCCLEMLASLSQIDSCNFFLGWIFLCPHTEMGERSGRKKKSFQKFRKGFKSFRIGLGHQLLRSIGWGRAGTGDLRTSSLGAWMCGDAIPIPPLIQALQLGQNRLPNAKCGPAVHVCTSVCYLILLACMHGLSRPAPPSRGSCASHPPGSRSYLPRLLRPSLTLSHVRSTPAEQE